MDAPTMRLSDEDHANMDVFLGKILDAYTDEIFDRGDVIGTITHVLSAVERGDIVEAQQWISGNLLDASIEEKKLLKP